MAFRDWWRKSSSESEQGQKNVSDEEQKASSDGATSEGGWSILTGGRKGGGAAAVPLTAKGLLEGYSSMPWLRAAAGRVSESVAVTPWSLFRPLRHPQQQLSGKTLIDMPAKTRHKALKALVAKQEMKEVSSEHPLLKMLTGGSDLMPGQQVLKLTQIHLDLAGEAFWLLDRDKTRTPRAIYPLVPTWVRLLPTRKDPFYTVQMGDEGEKRIPVTEVIRFTDPDPLNPFGRGSGLAKTLADELQTDEFAAKLMKMRFINSGRPDLIVSADELNPDEVQRLEEGWLEKVGGVMKSFRPFFAARKLDVKVISQTFQEMQMIELRKYERDSIIQTWGMPPEILGILTNSNRATIQSADFIFSAWVVLPRLEFLRRTLQFSLVPMFDDRLVLDFESPIDEDRDFKLVVMKVAPKAFKMDEFRELAGLDPLPDKAGEELYDPGNVGQISSTPPEGGGLPSSVASLEDYTENDPYSSLPSFRRRLTN